MEERDGCYTINDRTCPVCGRNFIPAAYRSFKYNGVLVCRETCRLKAERESLSLKRDPKLKPVDMYDISGAFLDSFSSAKDAASMLHIPENCIRRCCRGEVSRVGGVVFRYKTTREKGCEGK